MAGPKPTIGGVPTRSAPLPSKNGRTQRRHSKAGQARGPIPANRHAKPSSHTSAKAPANPPLRYTVGPFEVEIVNYDCRFFAYRGNVGDRVLLQEVETVSWDDSSAVMTGSLTVRTPEWASKYGIVEGHEIVCEVSSNGGHSWTPLWRMRVVQPNTDYVQQERTFNLLNDLNRMQQSDDDFVFAKNKRRPAGWRVDQVIREICTRYGFRIAQLPVMKTRIKNWHLTDQRPLDVIHSALLREKNATGNKFAVMLDARKQVHIYPFRRPKFLLQVGPTLIAATLAAQMDARFATALTVRAAPISKTAKDRKGHKKVRHVKVAADTRTAAGIRLYGLIHRNLYSADAESNAAARKEGKLFLAAIGKPKRQFTVTMPGAPFLRRLDAMRYRLSGISQVVYVTDANHTWDASAGYTTEVTLTFDDPYVDQKSLTILNKLSDTAVARRRKPSTAATKPKPPKPSSAIPRQQKQGNLGGKATPSQPRTAKSK